MKMKDAEDGTKQSKHELHFKNYTGMQSLSEHPYTRSGGRSELFLDRRLSDINNLQYIVCADQWSASELQSVFADVVMYTVHSRQNTTS